MEEAVLRKRIDALLESKASGQRQLEHDQELLQGALTIMSAVYGPESQQIMALHKSIDKPRAGSWEWAGLERASIIRGALKNLKAELEAGMVGSLQKRMAGEVLTDFIQLNRTTRHSYTPMATGEITG